MEQLFGQFGQSGPFDLSLRPETNASLALSAVHTNGKKALFVKYRVPRKTGSI